MSEERVKFVREFLEKMDKKGLCEKVNSKLLNDEYVRKFPLTLDSSGNVFNSIIEHYEDGKTTFGVSHEDMGTLVLFFGVHFVNSSLEYVKKMLMLLIPKFITNSENFITYGRLLSLISDKLGEKESYRDEIYEVFFRDIRNAISHVDYFIEKNGLYIKINNKKEFFDIGSFTNIIFEVKTIIDTILKFVNDKTKELEKKAEELDKKAEELEKKTLLIEQANRAKRLETTQLKQKASKIKSEIKRMNRDTDKIHKITEITDRKKPKDKIRIISKSEERSSLYDDIQ